MFTWRALSLAILGLLLCSDTWAATTVSRDSTPLTFLPFQEGTRVRIVQGNDENFSHSGTLVYSYDFDMGSNTNSRSNPIYGEPIYSPVRGIIRAVRTGAPDFSCNNSSSSCNNNGTGNAISIQVDGTNYYVNLMHMQDGSIPSSIRVGRWVEQGDYLGNVGQSGFSSHPHLHMHLSTSALGRSVAFDFVEVGNPDTDDWAISMLAPTRYVIDNDRRANLGAPISNPSAATTGTFRRYSQTRTVVGDDYMVSTSSSPYFYWYFTITNLDGYYNIYATCKGTTSRDDDAQYRVYGGGISRYTYFDQADFRYEWADLGRYGLDSSTRYTVRVHGSGDGSLCADAIVIELD